MIFFNDVWILQLFIFYLLCLIIVTKNNYYILLYLFLEIIFFGLYIGLIQGELFTGFLWVLEFTIIFIALIFLFYLNIEGSSFQVYINFFFFFFFFIYIFLMKFTYIYTDLNLLNLFNNVYLWDDYYEAFSNKVMNDFMVLTISYYSLNNFELLILGLLLLVGSIICVILNRNQKLFKNSRLADSSKRINHLLSSMNFMFLRRQNFNKQAVYKPNIRMFKKKQ